MAIALVQQTAVDLPPTASPITMPGNLTAGNTAFLIFTAYNAGVTAVSFGGTAGVQDEVVALGDGTSQEIWRASNLAGGSASVAITWSGDQGTYMTSRVLEFSGLVTSSPIDRNPAIVTGTSSTPTSNSTGTLVQAEELAISILGRGVESGSFSVPSGWTEIFVRNSWNLDSSGGAAYLITSATTAIQAAWTATSSEPYGVGIITYKAAAGGALIDRSDDNTVTLTDSIAAGLEKVRKNFYFSPFID